MSRIVRLHQDAQRPVTHVFGTEGYLLTVPRGFRDPRLRLGRDLEGTDVEELKTAGRVFEQGRVARAVARASARASAPIGPATVKEQYLDRRRRRYLILEPGPSVRVSLDDFDRYPAGTELDAEQVGALRAGDAQLRLAAMIDRLCVVRPRTEREIRERLGRRGVEASPALDQAIARYRNAGLILDDEAFARWFVEHRGAPRGKGLRALAPELSRLVSDRSAIGAAADETQEDEAFATALTRARRGLDLALEGDRRKFAARLARRGFSFERIRPLLASAGATLDDDE
jgi:SOS response regulatory protein OraA/RecX